MVDEDSPAMLPLEESPWIAMYETLAGMIATNEDVVDLGCGTGRFLELLSRKGHSAQKTGIDWSEAALEQASNYYSGYGRGLSLRREDLAEWKPDPNRAGNTIYVCSEVLEHLEDDWDLVRRIPPGHRFLFSVPNFDSESHLRTFPGVGDVWERYAGLLIFTSWSMVGSERKGIHVLSSIRREESW
jgi:2-polyprenyl-3-methyl-5-hydroxy-6-metoxy-1,4-benzoquinol methylase